MSGAGHGQRGMISMDCGRDHLPFKGKVSDTVKLIMFAQPYCCKIGKVADLYLLSGHLASYQSQLSLYGKVSVKRCRRHGIMIFQSNSHHTVYHNRSCVGFSMFCLRGLQL